MRLFVAVKFSEDILDELRAAMNRLRKQGCIGNFTRPENLHLTLAFLGETDRVSDVIEAMGSCRTKPFSIALSGGGHFGDVYWIGLEKSQALTRLAADLNATLSAMGFRLDKRDFQPHITIARQLESPVPVTPEARRASMKVESISLMRSDRINGRLIYTEVHATILK